MSRSAMLAAAVALSFGGLIACTQTSAAPGNERTSVYTELDAAPCQSTTEGLVRCPGVSGWAVEITDEGNIMTFTTMKAGAAQRAFEETDMLTTRGLGPKAEWRGTGTARAFRPDAVIVRIRPVEDDETISSLLIVSRLTDRGVCPIAVVDAKATQNANDVARTAADAAGKCGDPVAVLGTPSAAATAFQAEEAARRAPAKPS